MATGELINKCPFQDTMYSLPQPQLEKRFEKTSSAEVSLNAKGQAAFVVKIYFDVDEKTPTEVADKVKTIVDELKKRF